MKKKLKNIFSSKIWLTILTGICLAFICVSFFTDIFTKPLQNASSTIIVPLQKGVNGIGLWLTQKSELLNSLEALQKENEQLKEQIDVLSDDRIMNLKDQVELEQLRDLYELDKTYTEFNKIGANVIARNSDNWYSTFTIDKGSKDGICVDMNVIAGNGLVGLVTEVSEDYSIVRSIIDDSSKVSAMLLNTSDICTVSGDLMLMEDGVIRFQYMDGMVKIKEGDMLITSNISEKYHEGIFIGYAKDISMDSNDKTQSGYVVPAVDFKHIQKVLVILDQKTVIEK